MTFLFQIDYWQMVEQINVKIVHLIYLQFTNLKYDSANTHMLKLLTG